jgi:cyanophycinase
MISVACSALVALLVAAWTPRGAAQSPIPWWPTAGTVLLAGGGLDSTQADDFAKRLIALAGGPDALIVVIPTADPNLAPRVGSRGGPSDPEDLRHYFESLGARHVTVLHTRDRKTANAETFAGVLRSAKAVFLAGGQSLLLEAAYRGTLVERELRALLARGGVIGGDSAGAIAIGCLWLTWLPDPFGKRSDEFCLLPGVAVSPHASAARGYVVDDEVLKYLRTHPNITGIDIDENTVLVLRQGLAEVFGHGSARFLNAKTDARVPYLRVASGERHVLAQ